MALIRCKECGTEVSSKAKSCPKCGAVIKKKTGCLAKIGLIFIVFVVLGAIGSLVNTNNEEAKREKTTTQDRNWDTKPNKGSANQRQNKNQNKPKNEEKPISNLKWSEINKIYNLKSKKTDLQKKEIWKQYKGKKVKWSGKVSSVSETFGTICLQVKMNPNTLTSDLLIRLKDSERTKAMEFQKGDRVTFIGILDDWGTLMPITLDKGEIIK